MACSAGYSWIGLLGAFLDVWLMRQSAPLAGLIWLLFEQHWLTLVPLLVLLVVFLWSCPDESWSSTAEWKNPIPGCTASISKEVWVVDGVELASLNVKPAASLEKGVLPSWVPTVKEKGKCSDILPKFSLAFSPPWSLALWRGSGPEKPEWLGIRIGLKEHWDREVWGLLITITWALPYCRIPQILFPILPGGLTFSATAADPVHLIYQQPDALIHITASSGAARMHSGIWLL